MAATTGLLDRSLDEILTASKRNGSRSLSNRRREPPRDGVRKKSYRSEQHHYNQRTLNTEWVHDKFELRQDSDTEQPTFRRRVDLDAPEDSEPRGTKVRVENVHYELNQEDLENLFTQVGPVLRLNIQYDRAGRSEGMCFVTYPSRKDAVEAVRRFDGANALGQPIRLSIPDPSRGRNTIESTARRGRPLAERISYPPGRSKSHSPPTTRWRDGQRTSRNTIDRYIPGRASRSRSPPVRRQQQHHRGRRPGERSEHKNESTPSGEGVQSGRRSAKVGRPRKTQEELDTEMSDYFTGAPVGTLSGPLIADRSTNSPPYNDVEMIE